MERQHVAYLLIFVLMMTVAAVYAYTRYNSRERSYRRHRRRMRAAYEKRVAERSSPGLGGERTAEPGDDHPTGASGQRSV